VEEAKEGGEGEGEGGEGGCWYGMGRRRPGEEGGKENKGEASFYIDGAGHTRITGGMVWSDITEGVKFKYKVC